MIMKGELSKSSFKVIVTQRCDKIPNWMFHVFFLSLVRQCPWKQSIDNIRLICCFKFINFVSFFIISRIGKLMNEVVDQYGVVWVASAGNHGPALCTIGTPPDISQPSCIGKDLLDYSIILNFKFMPLYTPPELTMTIILLYKNNHSYFLYRRRSVYISSNDGSWIFAAWKVTSQCVYMDVTGSMHWWWARCYGLCSRCGNNFCSEIHDEPCTINERN